MPPARAGVARPDPSIFARSVVLRPSVALVYPAEHDNVPSGVNSVTSRVRLSAIFGPMATPSEQKALAFVAMVVLLGGVVRVVRAGAPPDPSSAEQQALARQAVAAESASAGSAEARSRGQEGARAESRAAAERARRSPRSSAASPAFPPVRRLARRSPTTDFRRRARASTWTIALTLQVDFRRLLPGVRAPEAPGSRWISTAPPSARSRSFRGSGRRSPGASSPTGIRSAPSARIEALGRVKGVGPATRKRLAALVTFSGGPSSRP